MRLGFAAWIVALAASGAAFLLLNWPPARIFMGDAGSTYLGFMQAFFALDTVASGWLTPWQWLILGAVFLTDATVTLLRRLLNGERIFEAHRRHAYQVLSRRWGGHRPVTLACIAVNIVWLWPLAYLAGLAPEFGWLVASAAYVPLIVAALAVGAGAPEKKSV